MKMNGKMSEEKAESSTPSPIARRDFIACLGDCLSSFDMFKGVGGGGLHLKGQI